MGGITELGYVRFGVSSLSDWRDFGKLIGLEMVEDPKGGRIFCRTDLWHHRIVLEENPADDLLAAGLRVAGPEEFLEIQGALRAAAIPFEVASDDVARDRRVLQCLTLTDPTGIPLEIFHGPQVDSHRPFHPGRGMYGKFVTSEGGLGHMMLGFRSLSENYAFYKRLGMRGSIEYKIPLPSGTLEILFMHCNARDHSLAFGFPGKKRLNHIMFEVSTLDDVWLTYELMKRAGVEMAILPGRHANDQMFSFYCISPSGFQVEIGWGARPATHQSEYYTGDTYGHEFTPKGFPS